ncbi:MAG: acyl-CoA thioesterase [Helicobacteraceae bacterium]|nr:acyl-CoA thioesterase [Helicobacteraceae bacterium]
MENIFDRKSLSMTILMTPELSNFSGVVHGGHIMRMLDQVAYACATRYCGVDVVTVYVDDISFKNPIPIGNLVTFLAKINYTGKTSVEVGIKVISEDIKNRTATHTNSCYFTMVALDPDGVPLEIDKFIPETEEEKRRYNAAIERKKSRSTKK